MPGLLAAERDDLSGDFGEIEGVPAVHPTLTAGQREQRLDEVFLLFTQHQELLAGRAERLRVGVWVGEGHLEQGPLRGQGRAQLV